MKPIAPLLAVGFAALTFSSRALADYPVMSHRYLADPGSIVLNGRIYLYNSNDDDNPVEGGYEMKSIVCVSTSDLKNWTDHGEVFRVPRDASWAHHSWAPQPIERGGTIYLYFGNNANGLGVATSKDPTKGFKDGRTSALVDGSTPGASGSDIWLFDPGALIDDDGQAYVAFGGNGESNARIIKLGSDLVSVSGSAVSLSPKGFFEASFLFKRSGTYYYAYSTNSANGLRIDYLTSKSPMSGYEYGGVVAGQPPENGNNNHASEFVFNGRWYHAYHNRTVAMAAGISATYRRNLAIEVLDFNEDGSIKQVTYTKDGVPQVGHLNPYVQVEAETMNAQNGIETEACDEGGMDVTSIASGDWIKVRGVDFAGGAKTFSARVAGTMAGSIDLRLDSATGTSVGKCDVPATGGAQMWQTVTCDVSGAAGVKDLVLSFTGSFNFNYWQFTPINPSDGMGGSGGGGSGGAASGGAAGSSAAGSSSGGVGAGGTSSAIAGAPGSGSGNGGGAVTQGGGGSGAQVGGAGAAPAAGSGGSPNGAAAAEDSGGCGCVVGAGSSPRAGIASLLAASLLVLRLRRRGAVRRPWAR
jgi:arabinoxylan arabinofuranohydrolase